MRNSRLRGYRPARAIGAVAAGGGAGLAGAGPRRGAALARRAAFVLASLAGPRLPASPGGQRAAYLAGGRKESLRDT